MQELSAIDARIAERLRALRLTRGLSTEQIAEAIGAKKNTVTLVENGRSTLSAAQVVAAAQALGVLVSVLVGEMPADGVGGAQ